MRNEHPAAGDRLTRFATTVAETLARHQRLIEPPHDIDSEVDEILISGTARGAGNKSGPRLAESVSLQIG